MRLLSSVLGCNFYYHQISQSNIDMSTEIEPIGNGIEEEVDDLFGGSDNQQDGAPGLEDDSNSENDEDEQSPEVEQKTLDVSMPRHAKLFKPQDDTYLLRMPVFLNVDAHPFDPADFKQKVQYNSEQRKNSEMSLKQIHSDLVAEKLLNENTLRWRYSNRGDDEIVKQLNAHFIQWDDGSLSLKIGNELFDYKELPITDNFLVRSHDELEILQNDAVLTKQVNLLPTSTTASTHRKLTQAVKNIQRKDTILNTITENDPMLKQRLADENDRKALKLKRQIEAKRRQQDEKIGSALRRGDEYDDDEQPAYALFEKRYGNEEYDMEDDFVDDGDEEEEEGASDDAEEEEEEFEKGAERLKQLKEDGASKYRGTPDEDDDQKQRKKRRIIDSDEDE